MTTVVVVKDRRRVVDSKVVGSYRDVGVGTWICRASAVVVVVAGKTTEGAKLRHTRLLVLLCLSKLRGTADFRAESCGDRSC
ncbi:unnamed protein product [Sphagnum jensenii]|jgi:hypothetical protein|uniref:Uncharacterized protein n=1 Tax=Sphagnum jensenii TaxID=128206 RepID=A0ABP0WCB3_9BRYO